MNCTFANESYPSFLDFGCVEFRCGNEHSNSNNGTEHSVHLEIAWFVKSYDEKQPDYEAKIRRGIEVLTALLIIRNRMHSLTVTAYLCSSWEREKKRKREKREKRSRKENKQNKRRIYFLLVKRRASFRFMSRICNAKTCFYLAVTQNPSA
jgi:hypothetical protein